MQQRDYLLRQIEQMSQVLVVLIRKLLGLKSDKVEEQTIQTTDEMLKEHFDISMDELLSISLEDVAEIITQKKGLSISNLELFAEVMVINAKACSDISEQIKLFEIGRELYQWTDDKSSTFSMERQLKMKEIEELIAIVKKEKEQ